MSEVRLFACLLSAALICSASDAQAAWYLIDDFQGRTAGDAVLGTTGPGGTWTSSAETTDHTVEVDPDDPANLAMKLPGTAGGQHIRADFTNDAGSNIAAGATGTFYYRFRTPAAADGTVDAVVGLTDNPDVTNFNFKSGLRNTNDSIPDPANPRNTIPVIDLDVRDQGNAAGAYQQVSVLQDDTWYSLWMVSTNTSPGGFHEVYLQSDTDPAFATQKQMDLAGDTTFNYRIDEPSDIINAYFRTGTNADGTALSNLYYDDIWMNGNARNLGFPAAIPEPTGVVLLVSGLGMFLARRR